MTENKTHDPLERLILDAIKPLIRELRMVDVADYVAFLRFEKHPQITDLFESAVEQFYAPGFLIYREAGDVDLDWGKPPIVNLELALNTPTATFEFILQLQKSHAAIELGKINRHATQDRETADATILRRAISINTVAAELAD